MKYAYAVSLKLGQLQGTPIATEVDLKRPVVVRDGEPVLAVPMSPAGEKAAGDCVGG